METAPVIVERPLPQQIGRYKILCELGHGAMAVLYLGRSVGVGAFERLFAIKMIHEHLSREQAFVNMFLNEARLCARIHHPNVVSVYDVDVDTSGRYYLAMDYLSGENLALALKETWNKARPFPVDLAAYIIAQACEGLHAAHELRDGQGAPLEVVHRDVAPQNLMIGYDGTVRVMDFGIAKAADSVSQTRPGAMKGTVAYMAPEQIRAEPVDRRTDVFALGVVLWETTVGKRLFKSANDINTAARVLRLTVPKPSTLRDGYPERLERIVLKALAREPDERYQTARALGADLQELLLELRTGVTAADLEAFMKSTFGALYEQRAEMERKASAPVVPDSVTSLPAREDSVSLALLEPAGERLDEAAFDGAEQSSESVEEALERQFFDKPIQGDAHVASVSIPPEDTLPLGAARPSSIQRSVPTELIRDNRRGAGRTPMPEFVPIEGRTIAGRSTGVFVKPVPENEARGPQVSRSSAATPSGFVEDGPTRVTAPPEPSESTKRVQVAFDDTSEGTAVAALGRGTPKLLWIAGALVAAIAVIAFLTRGGAPPEPRGDPALRATPPPLRGTDRDSSRAPREREPREQAAAAVEAAPAKEAPVAAPQPEPALAAPITASAAADAAHATAQIEEPVVAVEAPPERTPAPRAKSKPKKVAPPRTKVREREPEKKPKKNTTLFGGDDL